jgi:hypothetical protein
MADAAHVRDKRVLRQKDAVAEVVRLDTREPQRDGVAGEIGDGIGTGEERRAGALVGAPRPRRRHVHLGVGVGETAVVRAQQVVALGLGNDLREGAPRFRKEAFQARDEPVDLALPAQEDAPQDETAAALGMRLAVGEREGAAPRAAEHEPPVDLEVLPQTLDIGDQVRRGVVL